MFSARIRAESDTGRNNTSLGHVVSFSLASHHSPNVSFVSVLPKISNAPGLNQNAEARESRDQAKAPKLKDATGSRSLLFLPVRPSNSHCSYAVYRLTLG